MVLLKITAKDITRSSSIVDDEEIGNISLITIADLGYYEAKELYDFIKKNRDEIFFSDLNCNGEISATLIYNLDAIEEIKQFFEMEDYYSNSDYNLISAKTYTLFKI
jgi:hypothetical protein